MRDVTANLGAERMVGPPTRIAADAQFVTDGLASYNGDSLGPHQAVIQTKTAAARERRPQGRHRGDVSCSAPMPAR